MIEKAVRLRRMLAKYIWGRALHCTERLSLTVRRTGSSYSNGLGVASLRS
jgi:hypothetical protein